MVQVGTIEYKAQVVGAEDARSDADGVTGSFRDMGEQAEVTAGSTGFLAGMLGSSSDEMENTKGQADDTDESFTILSGTTWLLSRSMSALGISLGSGGLAGAFGTLSGAVSTAVSWIGGAFTTALGTIGGYLSSFVSWLLAGSAGALAVGVAIGTIIGLFGVWILEITGVLDWIGQLGRALRVSLPGWARDGLLTLIGLFAGALATIGAFAVGLVTGGFDQAFANANQVIQIFAGSFRRTFGRIADFFRGLWRGLVSFFDARFAAITRRAELLAAVTRAAFENTYSIVTGIVDSIRNEFAALVTDTVALYANIGDAIAGSVRTAFNGVVPGSVDIPAVTIGGGEVAGQEIPSTTIGGGTIDLPQLQSGGIIEAAGIAQVHEGEAVIPEPMVEAAASGGGAAGGDGGGTTVDVGGITLELSGDFDPSDLSRRELRELASDLADLLGDEIDTASGVR